MLHFVSAGAAQGLVATLAAQHKVEIGGSFGAVGAMRERFLAGDPCDIVILTDTQVAALVAAGRVRAGTVADLGAVATSVAVRADAKAPAIDDEATLRAALQAADAIYFPDPAKATAGIHFAAVLEKLGLGEALRTRVKTFPNGSTAMRALADAGGNPIGCTQATEILATPGVRLVAPLPRGFDLTTVYTAAVASHAAHADEARAFVALLTGDASRAARARAGFAGASIRVATAEDAPAIRAIVESVLGEYRLARDPAGTDSDLADLDAAYFARGGNFDVVVASDGRIVGCCGVYPHDAATGELRKMYLVPEARGQGLGGRLLRRALAFARGRGFRRIELETASVLTDAIALYRRAGFEQVARAPVAGRCDQAFALDL